MDTPLFVFGAMSPYSWFAAERIGALIPDARWQPVFAGGLFESCGRRSWGLAEQREVKLRDCEDRALQHGLGTIRWPSAWPTSDILVTRAMVVADQEGLLADFALAAMRAAFTEAAELSDLSTVQRVAHTVGLDPDHLTTAVRESAVKDAVRAGNERALALGVTGLPTTVVGAELFWGDDRLDAAAAAARAQRS